MPTFEEEQSVRRSACRWCGSRFHPAADCPERHPVYGVVARWVCTGCGRPLMLAPSEEPCCGQGAMRRPACADETGSQWVNRVGQVPVSYTHLRAHETRHDLVCRLLLEK